MKIYVTIILIFFTSYILAQEADSTTVGTKGYIKGIIADAQDPVPFASITVEEPKRYATANEEGQYTIELPVGEYTITVTAVGLKGQSQKASVIADKETVLYFVLDNSVFQLDQMVITASRTKQYLKEASVILSVTISAVLQKTQSISLSEGL